MSRIFVICILICISYVAGDVPWQKYQGSVLEINGVFGNNDTLFSTVFSDTGYAHFSSEIVGNNYLSPIEAPLKIIRTQRNLQKKFDKFLATKTDMMVFRR